MRVNLVPLLGIQRSLLDIPRGMARFEAYKAAMVDGEHPSVPPLSTFNPMSKEHVADRLDDLAAMGAEDAARLACAEACERLGPVEWTLNVGLVVADDVAGGWTHRELTEARVRFTHADEYRLGWASVLLWAGEDPSVPQIRIETLAAIRRALWQREFGAPRTVLRAMLAQESAAAAFAGVEPELAEEEVDYTRQVVQPHLDSAAYPVSFTCMYGDDAARDVGYEPLGLSKRAGFALAAATSSWSAGLEG